MAIVHTIVLTGKYFEPDYFLWKSAIGVIENAYGLSRTTKIWLSWWYRFFSVVYSADLDRTAIDLIVLICKLVNFADSLSILNCLEISKITFYVVNITKIPFNRNLFRLYKLLTVIVLYIFEKKFQSFIN